MIRHTGIVEDLRLDECGLTYLDMDPWGFAPFGAARRPAGDHVPRRPRPHLCLDRRRLRRARRRGLPRVRHRLGRPQRGGLRGVPGRAVRRPASAATSGAPARPRTSAAWRCRGSSCSPATSCSTSTSTDERLKTALAWLGAQSGPPTHEVATADLVGWNALMHSMPPGPRRRRQRRTHRGAGRTARPHGRHPPRVGDGAARITRDGDRVTGVAHRRRRRTSAPAPSSRAATSSPPSSCSATRRCSPARPVRSGSATASAWSYGSPRTPCRATRVPTTRRTTCTPRCSCSRRAARTSGRRTASSSRVARRPSRPCSMTFSTTLDPSLPRRASTS